MISLGILTDVKNANLVHSDKALPERFRQYGIDAKILIWDQNNWSEFTNILIRSTWDYSQKSQLFQAKIHQAQSEGVNLIHKPEIVLWNMDKSYLLELSDKMNVIPTIVSKNFSISSLHSYYDQLGEHLVFKPKLGAGGLNTFQLVKDQDPACLSTLEGQDILIQPFIKSIQSIGEYSFIFFESKFSHAVIKNAKADEFRVQLEHGGLTSAYEPTNTEITTIQNMLNSLNFKTVYARVDVVIFKNEFYLMELELIEPDLFLSFSTRSTDQFVRAVVNNLKKT